MISLVPRLIGCWLVLAIRWCDQFHVFRVCPLSVASNWSDQAAAHCPVLKVSVFHGPARSSAGWADAHCVITTYSTLTAEAKRQGTSALFTQRWGRTVFDEAHTLRNQNTKQAKAAFALNRVGYGTFRLNFHHFDRIALDLRGNTHVRGAAFSCLRSKLADMVLI